MLRRKFIARLTSFIVPLGFVQLLGRGFLADKPGGHVCVIDIEFPQNSGPVQFEKDRARWINIDDFDRILRAFEKRGMTRSEVFNESSMQVTFLFKDTHTHDAFAHILNSRGAVNDRKLESMGYKFSRKSYRA